jgi:protoheme IX farnesyltransferase
MGLALRRDPAAAITTQSAMWALLGTALIVAGANALNMYIERDIDGRMDRTRERPLPTGRLSPRTALVFGVLTSAAAVPILAVFVNITTALFALLANVIYVLAYTPLKQRSQYALFVGAVPGAIPPLLGYTSATGTVGLIGLVLFGVLFFWQIPHFLAIALFRKGDYARAGLVVTPNVVGDRDTIHAMIRYATVLTVVSLLLLPLHGAGHVYAIAALILGVIFVGACVAGLWVDRFSVKRWARGTFGISILYLLGLFAALFIDA